MRVIMMKESTDRTVARPPDRGYYSENKQVTIIKISNYISRARGWRDIG